MRQTIRKFISSILALAMVFSLGTSSLVFAAEDKADDELYTITLGEAENGKITFTEKTDGKFAAGDEVNLKLEADDGYIPARLTISETDSGNEVVSQDTDGDLATFTMPKASLTVVAEFALNEKAEPDDTVKVEDFENDLVLEEYIRENANKKYVGSVDSVTWMNVLDVQNTLFDGTQMKKGDTIDSIMSSNDMWNDFITSLDTSVAVYNVSNDSDYFVALVDTMLDVDETTVFDFVVTENNDDGNVIDGCKYDAKTGLLYIPKTAYTDGGTYEINTLQAQIGQKLINGEYEDLDVDTEYAVIDDDTADIYTTLDNIFAMETTTKVEAGLDEDKMKVCINGLELDPDDYDYNSATGDLTLAMSSASVATLSVVADPDDYEEASDKSSAVDSALTAYASSDHPTSWKDMYVANPDEPIEMPSWVGVGTALVSAPTTKGGDDGGVTVRHWTWNAIRDNGGVNAWLEGATKGYIYDYGHGVNGGWSDSNSSTAMKDLRQQVNAVWNWDTSDEIINDFSYKNLYTADSGLYFKFMFEKHSGTNTFHYATEFQGQKLHNQTETTPDTDDGVQLDVLGDVMGQCVHLEGDAGQAKITVNHVPVMARILYERTKKDEHFAVMSLLSASINASDSKTEDGDYYDSGDGQAGWTILYVNITENSGFMTINKESDDTSITDGNSCYKLAGATYQAYTDAACTQKAKDLDGENALFTIKSDGSANVLEVEPGTYYVKEASRPDGYELSDEVQPIEVTSENDENNPATPSSGAFKDTPLSDPFDITIRKIDAETGKDAPQGEADLSGAEFTVKYYAGDYDKGSLPSSATKTWVYKTVLEDGQYKAGPNVSGSLVSDKSDSYYTYDGKTVFPLGTYTISETGTPTGYLIEGTLSDSSGNEVKDGDIYYTQLVDDGSSSGAAKWTNGNSESLSFTKSDQVIRGGVKVQKRDAESGRDQTQGSASWEGIVFEIVNDSTNSVRVEGKDYEPGEVVYTMTLDENGYAETASDLLPYGKYIINEVQESSSYLLGNGDHDDAAVQSVTSIPLVISEDGVIVDKTQEGETITDLVHRADIALDKHDAETQESMSVPFQITSTTTGESHVFWTDANGDYSSDSTWNKHSYHTDAGETPEDGLWFYGYSDWETCGVEVDDAVGALPYDTYQLDELECEANEGKELIHTTFEVTRDTRVINLGQYVNADKTIEIGTTLTNDWEGEHGEHEATVFENENISLTDTIHYTGLTVGQSYTMKGVLMNKATGEVVLDDNGEEVRAERTFTPEEEEGDIEITFSFPASTLSYTDVVAYEYLYKEGEEETIAFHEDINDTDQTVHLRRPTVWTEATEVGTGNKYVEATDDVNIVDMLDITDLIVGHTYFLYGKAVDKETGETVVDENGEPIELTVEFVAESEEVLLDVMNFHIDALGMEGKSIVFEEYVYADADRTILICEEEDLGSAEQTITFLSPIDLQTTLTDTETDSHVAVQDDHVILTDTVDYEGAIVGETYTMSGTLMDKETGEAVHNADGSDVTASTEFVAETEDGEVQLTFDFDATQLDGDATVAFERLYNSEATLVGTHEDIDDAGQTVTFPSIHTNATDSETGTNVTEADEEAVIVDTVTYEGLTPGEEYTVEGTLMNQYTGEAVLNEEGAPVTSSTTFTPESADGEVEVTFTFDASDLGGATLVVYEQLLANDVVVATHEDLYDEAQTVYVPAIQTTATDAYDGDHTVDADGEVTIIDTVEYENLTPGQEYTMQGELMDEATGESLGISNEVTFTPEESSGSVEVPFTFNAADFAGIDTVVFEKCYMTTDSGDQAEVAKHEDLNDEGQTVSLVSTPTTSTPPSETPNTPDSGETPENVQTGDNDSMYMLALIAALCMAFGFGLVYRRREDN